MGKTALVYGILKKSSEQVTDGNQISICYVKPNRLLGKKALARNIVTLAKPTLNAAAMRYDVFDKNCPTRLVLDRLGDKWALLVLDRLRSTPVRFNALRRSISGVSQKMLSQVLKRLERDGLVTRSLFPTVPVTVEYALTPLGATLTDAVAVLTHWAEANMSHIAAAQAEYDANALSRVDPSH
jgi:DNA-binding HxlR family transcriptional regulator